MADFIKSKIIARLAKFTKDLKPQDINLSFFSGKGELSNLELDPNFLNEILQLPPWIEFQSAVCDNIKAKIHFTRIQSEPILIYINELKIKVKLCEDQGPRLKQELQFGGHTKYGFTEKVIDGMKIEIKLITVEFDDPIFKLHLSMHDIIIESKTPKWENAKSLSDTRIKNEEEDYVILYKEIKLASMRISGESTLSSVDQGMQLKLVMSETSIRVAFKRRISTSTVMYLRFVLRLGDMVLILTQSQLKGVSLLIQSLIRRGLDSYHKQKKRKQEEKNRAEENEQKQNVPHRSSDKKTKKTSPPKKNVAVVDASTSKETILALREKYRAEKLEEKLKEYQDGRQPLPVFEIVQNSFHIRSGRLDIQFCDDVNKSMDIGGVNSSLLIMLEKFALDLYLDQKAFSGRKHWAGFNRIVQEQVRWVGSLKENLMQQQQKRPELDSNPRIHLDKLHEIGIKLHWQSFKIDAVSTTTTRNLSLPLLRSDKATFNIPDDREYPAVQVNITVYHYPDVFGSAYLAPRPNVYVYCCPIHINFDQKTCVWIARFARAILGTIDTNLATSVRNDFVVYLDKLKQKAPKETDTTIMPGADVKVQVLFSKITIPLSPETLVNNHKVNLDDGRPKALQVETSEINIFSTPIGNLSSDSPFNSTLKSIKTGWLFSNAHANSFPHEATVDGDVIPSFMETLLSNGFQNFILAPGETPTCPEACLTAWRLEVRCVCVSFVHEMSQSGVTHNTKPFVTDFPLNVWLFENLSNVKAKSFQTANKKFKPTFHAVVNIPSTISAEINHLELLFLLRLGDSLSSFQLMMEEIFTFKLSDEQQINTSADSSKPTESKSLIKARRNRQVSDVDFEFTGCVLIKGFHFNAYLPSKMKHKQNDRWPVYSESEETPTHHQKCKILLKAPTIDELENLPHGEPYVSESTARHNAVITGPISVSPDPGLQHALQKSLPGTPRIYTPRSQSPSMESTSTDTPTTLSHSGSLASMNIDDAMCQFSGHQEDDFYIINTKDSQGLKMFNEKDNVMAAAQGSPASITEGLPHESLLEFTPQEHVKQKELSQVQAPQNQTELREGTLPGNLESRAPDEGSDDKSTQPVHANSTTHVPSNPVVSQENSSQQTMTQPQKHLPPADVQNQVETGEETIPVVDDSNQQVQISSNNPVEDPPEALPTNSSTALPTNSSTSLDNVIPEENTLTISDLNEGHQFSPPVTEEIHWQLQVTACNICAIPIVNPTGLIAKLSAGRIDLKEEPILPLSSSTETLAQKDLQSGDADVDEYALNPSVRGRFELGPRIYKYYPTLEELHIPCVVQLHVNGVNASLLLSLMENLALMFEDEIKSSIPVPLYIVLEGNQFLILESPDGHAEDFNTLNVSVNKVCIQRGPEVPKLAVWRTEHLGGDMPVTAYKETTPVAETVGSTSASNTIDAVKSKELDALLTSIKTFTASVQPQVDKLASLSQVQRINQAMLELQNVIGVSEHSEPPPQYSESVDHHNASVTIASLHKDVESLQEEQKVLQNEIKSNQEQLQAKDTELSHLVGELVKSKDSEVAMKEVVFRLNNQIQDVVMENDQLKVTMARAGLRVPVGKRH